MASTRRPSGASRQGQARTGQPRAAKPSTYESDAPLNPGRTRMIAVVFAAIFLICLGRLFYLQVLVSDEYTQDAVASRTITYQSTPRRGTIYDRNGVVLACSVDATTIYVNPQEVTDAAGEASILAEVLGGKAEDYREILETKEGTFAYIKRQADVTQAKTLEDRKNQAASEKAAQEAERKQKQANGEQLGAEKHIVTLDGIYFLDDTRREYPCGEVAGQIIGMCNLDGKGLTGLELYYDDILSGTKGNAQRQAGLGGTLIPGENTTGQVTVDGTDIMISIDVEMQAHAEALLKEYAELWGVDTEMLLMDGSTGEILAAASLPLFNPSDPSESEGDSTYVKTITSPYEPGSIFKTVSALSVLTHKAMGTEDRMDVPAALEANGYVVTDAHERDDVNYSLREIIQYSSNVGISLAVEKEGFEPFYNDIVNWDLNTLTGVDYPGESNGYLLDFGSWSKIQGYNITFGQGVSVTPLQMVRFYAAIANSGVQTVPHFLIAYPETQEQVTYETKQIITDQEALEDTKSMLESVVTDGTGKAAAIDGYGVAGKTGTAEIYSEEGGYQEGVYNISFTGFLNQSTSKLVCFTGSLELPAEGSTTALFRDIMTFAIERYKIAGTTD